MESFLLEILKPLKFDLVEIDKDLIKILKKNLMTMKI